MGSIYLVKLEPKISFLWNFKNPAVYPGSRIEYPFFCIILNQSGVRCLSECLPGLSGGVASWYVRTAVYNYCIDGSLAILCPSVTSHWQWESSDSGPCQSLATGHITVSGFGDQQTCICKLERKMLHWNKLQWMSWTPQWNVELFISLFSFLFYLISLN